MDGSAERDKTLHLRMQRHCENGEKMLNFEQTSKVVYYPGRQVIPFMKLLKNMRGFEEWFQFRLR
jgi:cystathionine beta-lyase